ncbi:hypothetical protein J7J18_06415 [bacterium]|nr:hypothetical protein [bacterium]
MSSEGLRTKSRDACTVVIEALMSGLRVKIGDYIYVYDSDQNEVFIVGKTSSGEEVLFRIDTLTLNGFIRIVHKEFSDEELLALVSQLTLRRLSCETVKYRS